MNYTTFFVALSALGVLVFVGIFGAVWLSATDQQAKEVHPVPGYPLTIQPPLPDTPPPTTGSASESPSPTEDEVTTVFLTTLSSPINPTTKDDVSTLDTSSTEKFEEAASETPEILDGPVRMAPAGSSSEISPSESTCLLQELTEEKGEIKPDYENEDTCQQWLVQYAEGYSVDIIVDRLELDGASGDYVLISSDKNTIANENNPVLSWTLTTKRNYRIPYKGTAYILFVSHKSTSIDKKPKGFRIIYSRSGETTTTSTSTSGPIPAPPPDNKESILITAEFNNVSSQIQSFREVIANEAEAFCKREKIQINTPVSYENVYLSDPIPCLSTWPNSENCSSFIMAIPVDTKSSKKYELTKQHLQKMWDEWSGDELSAIGIKKSDGPNYVKHVTIWFVISVAFIILFSAFLVILWQWSLRNAHIPEENKPKTSVPIEVPPLFDYFDTRLDDPEYLPYYDSMYQMGTETSTDDRVSYGALPPYSQRPSNFSPNTFHFNRPSNVGIDNTAFSLEEDEEDNEILNRANLTRAMDNEGKNEVPVLKTASQTSSNLDHIYEVPSPTEV